jgi:hypothetical protein
MAIIFSPFWWTWKSSPYFSLTPLRGQPAGKYIWRLAVHLILKVLSHQIFKSFLSSTIINQYFLCGRWWFWFFLYSGFILVFKDEVLMYMAQNACASQAAKGMPLVMHKPLKKSLRSRSQAALVNLLQIMQCLVRCTLKFYLKIIK